MVSTVAAGEGTVPIDMYRAQHRTAPHAGGRIAGAAGAAGAIATVLLLLLYCYCYCIAIAMGEGGSQARDGGCVACFVCRTDAWPTGCR